MVERNIVPYWRLLLSYVALKACACFIIYVICEYFYQTQVFALPDYASYTQCDAGSPNGFFSLLICALSIDTPGDAQAIMLAFALYLVRDIAFLLLARPFVSMRGWMLLALLMAIHPYMALYSIRFTSTMFPALTFMLLFWILSRRHVLGIWSRLAMILCTGLRNAIAPVTLAFEAVEAWRARKQGPRAIALSLASLAAMIFVLQLPDAPYAESFITASPASYPMGFLNILKWFDTGFVLFDWVLAILTTIVSHLILLLGFREGAFTHFPEIFLPFDIRTISQIVIFSGLTIVHGLGLYVFFSRFIRQDWRYALLLLYIFPWFLIVSHMRYLLPMMPFAMLGLVLLLERTKPQS